jgi:Putative death-receptor fusion protein (DUF2428)
MADLQKIAVSDLQENDKIASFPQVHALNCLKAIFTNNVLGPASEPYIVDVLTIAGHCLTSKVWAIRNCGLMLFRALIDRLLGSYESQNWVPGEESTIQQKKATRISWIKYPELQRVILGLLDRPTSELYSPEVSGEVVFPALKLIQQIPPPETLRVKVRTMLVRLSESAHWHVRDMAARAFSTLVKEEDNVEQILSSLLDDQTGRGDNCLHGHLQCARYSLHALASKLFRSPESFHGVRKVMKQQSGRMLQSQSPFVQAAFLDIYVTVFRDALLASARGVLMTGTDIELMGMIKEAMSLVISQDQKYPLLRKSWILTQMLATFLASVLEPETGVKLLDTSIDAIFLGDQNAIMWLLQELLQLEKYAPQTVVHILVSKLYSLILSSDNNSLTSTAEECLVKLIDRHGMGKHHDEEGFSHEPWKYAFLGNAALPPSRVESGIKVWSKLLATRIATGVEIPANLAEDVYVLLRVIRPLLDELMVSYFTT